jgi:hypothetical protein
MAANWLKEAGNRLVAFVLSLVCGIVVPLSTLPAEAWVRGEIDGVSWFSAGVTDVAGIGLVSSSKTGLIALLIASGGLAFIYGVDMKGTFDWAQANPGKLPPPLNAVMAQAVIASASLLYTFERVGRHLFDNRPFPE